MTGLVIREIHAGSLPEGPPEHESLERGKHGEYQDAVCVDSPDSGMNVPNRKIVGYSLAQPFNIYQPPRVPQFLTGLGHFSLRSKYPLGLLAIQGRCLAHVVA